MELSGSRPITKKTLDLRRSRHPVNWREKIVQSSDRVICALIAVLVLGSVLGFGGAVWWFRPVMAVAAFLLVAIKLAQSLATGRMPILKSPLGLLGLLALGLGVLQLAPLPAGLASRLSPAAHEAYARGLLPRLVHTDDPEASLPEAPQIRSPASLDRSATLRWLVEATACLGIFWSVSHFTDRLGRLYLVWGLVVAAFLFNVALAIVQITNRSDGLYGLFIPGSGPSWAPSLNDLLEAPTTAALRNLADSSELGADTAVATSKAVLIPTTPFLIGTMMGGPGAFLPGEPGASPRGHDAARFVSDRSGRRSVVLFASDPGAGDRRASGSGFARFSLAGLVRGNSLACRNRPGGDARGLLASAAGRTITRWTS